MGVCASSEVETTQDTFSVEIDSIEPIDPKELHLRCKKLLELSNIIPTIIMPKAIEFWRRNTRLALLFAKACVRIRVQEWKSQSIHTPIIRKKLSKIARIRNEVQILAELREARR